MLAIERLFDPLLVKKIVLVFGATTKEEGLDPTVAGFPMTVSAPEESVIW
jgi:hypothetical protein